MFFLSGRDFHVFALSFWFAIMRIQIYLITKKWYQIISKLLQYDLILNYISFVYIKYSGKVPLQHRVSFQCYMKQMTENVKAFSRWWHVVIIWANRMSRRTTFASSDLELKEDKYKCATSTFFFLGKSKKHLYCIILHFSFCV